MLLGEVWTYDEERPRAGAIYTDGGLIVDVGQEEDLLARYPDARRYRFERITPGLHDAHVHPLYWGQWLDSLDLRDESDPLRTAGKVAQAARQKKPGEWIRGGGYVFAEYPDSALLDTAAPHNPVYLESRDLHSAWVNQEALRLAGVSPASTDPEGGVIIRDSDGKPTGYLLERATELVAAKLPPAQRADLRRGLADLAARGYVAVHAMGDGPPEATEWVRQMALQEELPLRLAWALPKSIWTSYRPEKIGEQLHVFGVKYFADGALTSRTAWMKVPYADGGYGMPLDDPRDYLEATLRVLERGFVPVWHAIGSRAIAELLNLADKVEAYRPGSKSKIRIEHVQHVDDQDVARLKGHVLSMQPTHARDDAEVVKTIMPQRQNEAYRWRDYVEQQPRLLVFGSDAPVAEPDAIAGLRSAMRHPLDASRSISEKQAVAAYTHNPAAALGWAREERPWGIIAKGAALALTLWEDGKPVARVWRDGIENINGLQYLR